MNEDSSYPSVDPQLEASAMRIACGHRHDDPSHGRAEAVVRRREQRREAEVGTGECPKKTRRQPKRQDECSWQIPPSADNKKNGKNQHGQHNKANTEKPPKE